MGRRTSDASIATRMSSQGNQKLSIAISHLHFSQWLARQTMIQLSYTFVSLIAKALNNTGHLKKNLPNASNIVLPKKGGNKRGGYCCKEKPSNFWAFQCDWHNIGVLLGRNAYWWVHRLTWFLDWATSQCVFEIRKGLHVLFLPSHPIPSLLVETGIVTCAMTNWCIPASRKLTIVPWCQQSI